MTSRWCSNCEQIVTTNTKPNYCCWCGKDLKNEEVLPEFHSWEEREAIVAGLRKGVKEVKKFEEKPTPPIEETKQPAQLRLF